MIAGIQETVQHRQLSRSSFDSTGFRPRLEFSIRSLVFFRSGKGDRIDCLCIFSTSVIYFINKSNTEEGKHGRRLSKIT